MKSKVEKLREQIEFLEEELIKAESRQLYTCESCGKRFRSWEYKGGIDSTDYRIETRKCQKCRWI